MQADKGPGRKQKKRHIVLVQVLKDFECFIEGKYSERERDSIRDAQFGSLTK